MRKSVIQFIGSLFTKTADSPLDTKPLHNPVVQVNAFKNLKPARSTFPNVFSMFTSKSLPKGNTPYSYLSANTQRFLANQPTYAKPYAPTVYRPRFYGPTHQQVYKNLETWVHNDPGAYQYPYNMTAYTNSGLKVPSVSNADGFREFVPFREGAPAFDKKRYNQIKVNLLKQMNPVITPNINVNDFASLEGDHAVPYGWDVSYSNKPSSSQPVIQLGANSLGKEREYPIGFQDQASTLNHELEHSRQARLTDADYKSRNRHSILRYELPAVLKQVAADAEVMRRYYNTPRFDEDGLPTYSPSMQIDPLLDYAVSNAQVPDTQYEELRNSMPTMERLRAESERHGLFNGRPMTDILNRPEAIQYLNRLYNLAGAGSAEEWEHPTPPHEINIQTE